MADANKMPNPNTQRKQGSTTSQQQDKERDKPYFPRPKNKVGRTIPKPANLSKAETVLTNDPLWKDSFVIDGETGFTSEEPTRTFEADAAGYVNLIESEYKAIADVDKNYAKAVSQSAHSYYHIVLYWYTHALRAQKNGTASLPQERLVQFVQGYGSAQIASGAGEYLEGLGDYADMTGVKHRLHATEPNDDGHFGHIAHQTHGFYETLPAPAIALHRLAADIAETQRTAGPSDEWMPPGLAPAQPRVDPPAPNPEHANNQEQRMLNEEGAADVDSEGGDDDDIDDAPQEPAPVRSLPTVNLLGWQRAKILTANQLSELRDIVRPEDPRDGLINFRYSVNRALFEFVERRLRECKRYKLSIIPNTTGGSIVQQVIWKPLEPVTSRFIPAIAGVGVATSRTTLPLRAAIAAKVMCYRTLRRELETDDGVVVNTWACFSFQGYRAVPQNWRGNRNALIHRGYDGLINYAPFKTQVTPRNDTLLEYLNKFKTY